MFRQLMNRVAAAEAQPPWGIWGAIGAMMASFLAVIIGSAIAIIIVGETQYATLSGWAVGAAIVVAYVWFTRRSARYWPSLWDGTGNNEDKAVQNIFWYLLIGVGLAILLDLIGRAVVGLIIPDPELLNLYAYTQVYGQPIQSISWILVIMFMVVLQPLAESLVFQGLLLPSLRAIIAPWVGYLLAAAAYTMFHFVAYQPPTSVSTTAFVWIGILQPLIGGLIFGAVRVYTGSTRAAFLTHLAFGLFAVIKLLTLVNR